MVQIARKCTQKIGEIKQPWKSGVQGTQDSQENTTSEHVSEEWEEKEVQGGVEEVINQASGKARLPSSRHRIVAADQPPPDPDGYYNHIRLSRRRVINSSFFSESTYANIC